VFSQIQINLQRRFHIAIFVPDFDFAILFFVFVAAVLKPR